MSEGFPDVSGPETAEPDYTARGHEMLREMGVEDVTGFGSIALSAGDPEGRCTGTLAETVGRHASVRENIKLIVQDADSRGISPEEAALTNPFFMPYLAKDERGQPFKVASSEDVKKN